MIFTQYYLACLSHASYLIGDETTGRAVVVDPRRDVNIYLDEAAEHGLHIERVIETHIHADFLSGHPVRPASDRRGGWPGWVGSLRLAAG
jgi:hydroxyacylglutathione hydrolase